MGRIGVIKSSIKSAIRKSLVTIIKSDIGGGDIVSSALFSCSGDDSPPMNNDNILLTEKSSRGTYAACGSIDGKNQKKANQGEKRIYARDSYGNEIAEIWIKNTGEISIKNNAGGSFGLDVAGNFVANGVIIDQSGNIVTSGDISSTNAVVTSSLTVNGVDFTGHVHSYSWTGTAGTGFTGGAE